MVEAVSEEAARLEAAGEPVSFDALRAFSMEQIAALVRWAVEAALRARERGLEG